MAGMIEQVMTKVRNGQMWSIEDCVTECVLTYGDMGELLTELLEYHYGVYDERAMALAVEMMGEYIDERI